MSLAKIFIAVVTDGDDCGFVDQVGQVGTGEPRCRPRHGVKVDIGRQVLAADVHLQNGRALGLIREGDLNLPVEPSGTQQGRVERLGAVGGSHDDDAGRGIESVHFGQQLVERLLSLVVRHEGPTAPLADRIDLVDEDDRRSPLPRIGEEVPYPGRTDAHEELDKAGPGEGEEWDSGLTCDRSGHEGLAGARRAHHEHPTRAHGARTRIALRAFEEVDDFGDFPLCPFVPCNVGESGRGFLLVVDLGLRTAEPHDARERFSPSSTHPDEERDEEEERQEREQVSEDR